MRKTNLETDLHMSLTSCSLDNLMLQHEKETVAEIDIQADKAYMQKNQRPLLGLDLTGTFVLTCVTILP